MSKKDDIAVSAPLQFVEFGFTVDNISNDQTGENTRDNTGTPSAVYCAPQPADAYIADAPDCDYAVEACIQGAVDPIRGKAGQDIHLENQASSRNGRKRILAA